MNMFVAGDYMFSVMGKCASVLTDNTGDKISQLSDNADINQLLNDVDNMINSGVDGALWWGVLDPNNAVGPQKFEDAKIPFGFFDVVPSQKDMADKISSMKYFAGGASCNNILLGQELATQALADGCKTAIVLLILMALCA
jgi:ABC-type sugar transport system substrate-binding protein